MKNNRDINRRIANNNNNYAQTLLTPPTEFLDVYDVNAVYNSIKINPNSRPSVYLYKGYTQNAINLFKSWGHVVVLNFASSIQSGGGYINGNSTQEEALCRNTPLLYPSYCALSHTIGGTAHDTDGKRASPNHTNFFSPTGKHFWPVFRRNTNWDKYLLYTRNIHNYEEPLINSSYNINKATTIDVIAATAPKLTKSNNSTKNVSNAEMKKYNLPNAYTPWLESICKLAIIKKCHGSLVLILGAIGCGAYQNPCDNIAEGFVQAIRNISWYDDIIIIFAIPDNTNYNIFNNVFTLHRMEMTIIPEDGKSHNNRSSGNIKSKLSTRTGNLVEGFYIYKFNNNNNKFSIFNNNNDAKPFYTVTLNRKPQEVNLNQVDSRILQNINRDNIIYIYNDNNVTKGLWKYKNKYYNAILI